MTTRPTPLPVLLSPPSARTDALGGPSSTVEAPDPAGPAVKAAGDNQGRTSVQD